MDNRRKRMTMRKKKNDNPPDEGGVLVGVPHQPPSPSTGAAAEMEQEIPPDFFNELLPKELKQGA